MGHEWPKYHFREITAINKVSLNDVVMGISSVGMLRYLADMGCRPTSSLLAAVPVSLRPEGNTDMTNQVSMARMSLASNIKDPIERLHAIRGSSEGVKAVMSEMKTNVPTDFPSIGAPWLFSALANVLARSRLANSMPAFANMVISNVPGPNITLYFAGAKQISTYPVSIPYHGMALNITPQSYNGWLDFGLIGCRRAMPDITELARYMQAAHVELLRRSRELVPAVPAKVAAAPAAKPTRPARGVTSPATAGKPAKARPKPKVKRKTKAKPKPRQRARAS